MRSRLLPAAVTVAALLTLAEGLRAHHSISAVYDERAHTTLDGVVAEFQFVNPHPFLTMDIERSGRHEVWKLELDNRFELVDVGMKADTIKPGDRLVVEGRPARDGSRSIYAIRLDRPSDGFRYEQVGTSPRISRTR